MINHRFAIGVLYALFCLLAIIHQVRRARRRELPDPRIAEYMRRLYDRDLEP
jgi:hypothetical protein